MDIHIWSSVLGIILQQDVVAEFTIALNPFVSRMGFHRAASLQAPLTVSLLVRRKLVYRKIQGGRGQFDRVSFNLTYSRFCYIFKTLLKSLHKMPLIAHFYIL